MDYTLSLPDRGEWVYQQALRPTLNKWITPGIVATARLKGVASMFRGAQDGRWYFGPVGWVLEDVRPLDEPIPCRGAQGLWTVPDEIARRLP